MKVSELIEELEKFPGGLDIRIRLGEDISYDEVITIITDYPTVYSQVDRYTKTAVVYITN